MLTEAGEVPATRAGDVRKMPVHLVSGCSGPPLSRVPELTISWSNRRVQRFTPPFGFRGMAVTMGSVENESFPGVMIPMCDQCLRRDQDLKRILHADAVKILRRCW